MDVPAQAYSPPAWLAHRAAHVARPGRLEVGLPDLRNPCVLPDSALLPLRLPLTDQSLGLCRPIAFILRLELQKMPPILESVVNLAVFVQSGRKSSISLENVCISRLIFTKVASFLQGF